MWIAVLPAGSLTSIWRIAGAKVGSIDYCMITHVKLYIVSASTITLVNDTLVVSRYHMEPVWDMRTSTNRFEPVSGPLPLESTCQHSQKLYCRTGKPIICAFLNCFYSDACSFPNPERLSRL